MCVNIKSFILLPGKREGGRLASSVLLNNTSVISVAACVCSLSLSIIIWSKR